jgi:hypothetical protein
MALQILVSTRYIYLAEYLLPYTGISYVTSDQTSADKIEVIRQWPNGPGIVCKVPSIIAYENENEDEISQDEWGYRVEGGVKAYLWTKLLLGKDARSSDASNTEMSEIYGQGLCTLPAGKTAKEVCTDYLRGLYKYLVERLQKHDDHTYRITPIEFWVTVPAMWTDGAKSATIEAAQAAGFGAREMDSIHIITEPEAAALTVLMPKVGFGSVMGLQVCCYRSHQVCVTKLVLGRPSKCLNLRLWRWYCGKCRKS